MKHHKLGMKALAGLSILAVVVILSTCLTIDIRYKKEQMSMYNDIAFSYARTAAEYIDGDRIRSYVENNTEDDYYRQVQRFLAISQAQTDLEYYSVFVPYEEELAYIWDVGSGEGVRPLGYREAYMEGGQEIARQICANTYPERIIVTRDSEYGYIASAYAPVLDSAGETVAIVGVDLSMPGIRKALFHFLITVIFSVTAVVALLMGLFYVFIRKNIITPIDRLNRATKEMVGSLESEETFHVEIHTGDEIEELSESFAQMYLELREYLRELSVVTAEKERIGAELDIATQIQADMLPSIFPAFPEREEMDIYALMDPAKEVGGDFYDFFMVDDTHLAMVMADVSGKGVPAALFMVIGKTLIKDHTKPGRPLGEVFTEVNRLLCESNKEGLFITAFECVLDLRTGDMVYVNAGHEPPIIATCNEGYSVRSVTPQFVLAGFDEMTYKSGELKLAPGDRLFLFTDGVTEATNAKEELYGMDRLCEVLCANAEKKPRELLQTVKQAVDGFVGEAEQFDDITMLGMELRKLKDSLTLKAELASLGTVTDFVNGFMDNCGYDNKVQTQIDIVVEEIYVNICSYAYPDGPGDVTAEVAAESGRLTLTFADSGFEYNPLEKEDPDITLSAEEREIGGLGIFMVKQIMDEVTYRRTDGRNVLELTKNVDTVLVDGTV
ncbi:MAG: SpoIIE family protein phosphatase [Ruminococcus sp.]|nr:SpoIIE family protein phosphatase [Ruminococcus sp.]